MMTKINAARPENLHGSRDLRDASLGETNPSVRDECALGLIRALEARTGKSYRAGPGADRIAVMRAAETAFFPIR